ncbi:MAG: hypothetical protein ACODAD_00410 [Planctomycetota bacterium]
MTSVLARPPVLGGGTWIGLLSAGQANESNGKDARQVAQKWLGQARDAMKNGNLELAEYCIERAERQNVKDDPLFARFKDTPAKARQDLEQMRAGGSGGDNESKSSNPLARLFDREGTSSQPPMDPYGDSAESPATAMGPASSRGGNASSSPSTASTRSSGTNASSQANPPTNDQQERGTQLLLEARRALAKGDAQRAGLLVSQADKLGGDYPINADSPDKVNALVEQAARFSKGPEAAENATDHTRDFARFLMDQATGLLSHGAFDQARQLARQAKDLGAEHEQFDQTPDQLLSEISAVRRQHGGAGGNPNGSGSNGNLSDADNSHPRRLPAPAGNSSAGGKDEALRLVARARAALDRGDLTTAKAYAEKAQAMAPESAYGPNEKRPWMVLLEINKAMDDRQSVMPAGTGPSGQAPATEGNDGGSYPVRQGLYNPEQDVSRNVAAQTLQPNSPDGSEANQPSPQANSQEPRSPGEKLYQDGLQALQNHEQEAALKLFRDAWKYEQELDPLMRQQLQDKLSFLQSNDTLPDTAENEGSPLEAVDSEQQLVRQKLFREISSEQVEAQRMSGTDPKGALERLHKLRQRVSESEVDSGSKKQLLSMVDRSIESLQQYIDLNQSEIELNERNQAVKEGVALDAQRELEIQNELAKLVEEFNELLDEQRYAEAELIAKQAKELAPEAEVVQSLLWQSRFVRRIQEQMAIKEEKERAFYDTLTSVERSSTPFNDGEPYKFTDAREWQDLSDTRRRLGEEQRRLSEAEMEIQKAMNTKVDVKFEDRPLSEVMDVLSDLSGVPIVLDSVGMAAEGVTSDQPVTIRLNQQISLRSALNLILAPLRLSHVVQDEVLRVTSEQTRDSNVYNEVYKVGDLVIPIPNFLPGYHTGLAGAIKSAHDAVGYGGSPSSLNQVPLALASNEGAEGAPNSNASVLAQMGDAGMLPSLSSQQSQPPGVGPGGMGGAAMADYDSLMELISSTIAPDTWDEVGGAGAMEPFPTNLSLVISQTQEVHEQVADLLDQLRRLQDLQVTIEVRFITLNDNFFERIGLDFDFAIDDNVNVDRIRGQDRSGGLGDDTGPSAIFGLTQQGPTTNLDLEFTQGSFGAAVPQFGNFDAGTAASFGMAILSDLEVFFLLEAAEGDTRTNVLQAPKVTLFNGQTANVSDTSERPFVTSIIPVVGDFAAAQQPVIIVLREGTQMTVQAVVSSDRRFVRLTLVPFFSRIGPVEEFTFQGTTTTDSGTIVDDPDNEDVDGERENVNESRTGTTVQLPTFISTSVSTTVSVPDGGTVLLGGIKRLSEGRVERGVPMMSKLPYINRLFKNVGIGRETESLMMMVTPRIIVQEEEELDQTGYDSSP